MKLKKGLDVHTDDFWYDISEGGYLDPKEICLHQADAIKIIEAVKVIMEFEQSCEEQIEGFVQ